MSLNRIAPYYNRQAIRRQRPRAAVQEMRPVDGRSESCPERAAISSAPPSAFVVVLSKFVGWICAASAVAALVTMSVIVIVAGIVFAMIGGLFPVIADPIENAHGPYCDCDRCACPDCRAAQINCKCQRGSE